MKGVALMRRSVRGSVAAVLLLTAVDAAAQRGRAGGTQADTLRAGGGAAVQATSLETRVFTLQYLTPSVAAKLVAPFVPAIARAGVYDAGDVVQAITVKATRESLAQIDSVLRTYDRAPPSVRLKFQLIAATDSAVRDGAIPSDVHSAMGELFRYGGYKLLAEGTAISGGSMFQLSMSVDDPSKTRVPELFNIRGEVVSVATDADMRSVRLRVALGHPTNPFPPGEAPRLQTLLETGLSVPTGQTVVLGSAAGGQVGGRRALILTVRPDIQAPARR
jgi:hypothetical protein